MTKKADFSPMEHRCMALVLAAVAEGHRRVNPLPTARNRARRVTAAGQLLSYLGHALEMTIPRAERSPYFRDYAVVPPDTNEGLVKLLKNGVGLPAEGEIAAEPHAFPEERSIAPWDFLYGRHLLRGTVSGTAATGGTGKSSRSIVEAIEMAIGRKLLNDAVAEGRQLRVVLINLEDDRNTMDKRIAAATRHYRLTKEDAGDRLIVKARGEIKIKIARQLRSGDVERNELMIRALTNLMIEKRADVLSIDSFIRTHGVNENDNSAIEEVVECFEEIAIAANCAVHLWHHTRKENGQGATVDSSRGARSFIDACRSVRVIERMPKEEARKLDLEHGAYYFRSFSGKLNFAPPAEQSDWFKIESVNIENAFPFGDDVGVVTPWQHPGAREADLTADVVALVREAVGLEPRWRESPKADMWVGKAVAPILGLSPEDK